MNLRLINECSDDRKASMRPPVLMNPLSANVRIGHKVVDLYARGQVDDISGSIGSDPIVSHFGDVDRYMSYLECGEFDRSLCIESSLRAS